MSKYDLRPAMEAIYNVRNENEDVFKWPTIEWSAHYIHEELCELMRVIQLMQHPDHLRGRPDFRYLDGEPWSQDAIDNHLKFEQHMEWGQTLFMLLTLGFQLNIDPNQALELALAKVQGRSEAARGHRHQPDPE
jgi:hypothetical protein